MIKRSVLVSLIGKPVTQGSMQPIKFPNGKVSMRHKNGGDLHRWRNKIATLVKAHEFYDDVKHLNYEDDDKCYQVNMLFGVPRPKYHYDKDGKVKEKFLLTKPTKRSAGDLDKYIRAVFDALTMSGIIQDDSNIVQLVSMKEYGNTTTIQIEHMDWKSTEALLLSRFNTWFGNLLY